MTKAEADYRLLIFGRLTRARENKGILFLNLTQITRQNGALYKAGQS
jgi:hypothetical protein